MVEELGELPIGNGEETNRICRRSAGRKYYPLLKIDKSVECPESSMYSCFDKGSEHGDPIPVEDPEDGGTK